MNFIELTHINNDYIKIHAFRTKYIHYSSMHAYVTIACVGPTRSKTERPIKVKETGAVTVLEKS